MQHWQQLVKLALVGTERGNLTEATKTELTKFGLKADGEPTATLLEGAAMYAGMEKAGFLPAIYEKALPPKAETDTQLVCNKHSAQHLTLMLKGTHKDALNEFIAALSETGKRIPTSTLPNILDLTRTKPELWEQLHKIGGKRGEWLIKMNPKWKHHLQIPKEEAWEVGKKAERVALFKHLRNTNPERAIALLASTYDEESITNKKTFLSLLKTNLSEKDESFLESFLDKGKKEERQIISHLLATIPNSALANRMYERLEPLMSITKYRKLEIKLPDAVDDAMERDGIDPRFQGFKGGMKAGRFGQLFVCVPPNRWISTLGNKPGTIIKRFVKSDWAELLLQATAQAAILHDDADWKEALLNHWIEYEEASYWKNIKLNDLINSASETLFNQIAIRGFKRSTALLEENHPIVLMLKNSEHRWSQQLTVEVIKHLRNWLNKEHSKYWSGWHFRPILKKAGYKSVPQLHNRFLNGWPENSKIWSNWEKEVAAFLDALQFRKNMLEEIRR